MNKHINKKTTKHLEDYKKVQQRNSEETNRGCLKVSPCLSSYFYSLYLVLWHVLHTLTFSSNNMLIE